MGIRPARPHRLHLLDRRRGDGTSRCPWTPHPLRLPDLFRISSCLVLSPSLRLPRGGGWFIVQISINIGGVIGLLPVTGLTLPFISFGGSSLIASMAAAGLLMNVARRPR
ncbi:MAG: FtsW/RodA/SpoVE family cell cycle protein [Acidimicrobiia bacterium]|nr:FtsW/RodA/SpoVE family cell cycle protein [Acidimicrobiia bacterium]